MRQWLVDPKLLCQQHLLGERTEILMTIGTLQMGWSIDGYLRDKLLEPSKLRSRFKELTSEMIRRKLNPIATLRDQYELKSYDKETRKWLPNGQVRTMEELVAPYPGPYVDPIENIYELSARCFDCRKRMIAVFMGLGYDENWKYLHEMDRRGHIRTNDMSYVCTSYRKVIKR